MLTIRMGCTRCGKEFPVCLDVYRTLGIPDLPKRCPACLDELQGRPDVVLERETLFEHVVRVHASFAALFASAEEFRPLPTDVPTRRLTLRGSSYGACWRGRVDVYSHAWPLAGGDVVTLSEVAVRRRVWYVEERFRTSGFRGYVVERTRTRRVPRPLTDEPGVMEREEVNEYVSLTQTLDSTARALERADLPHLCWVEAHSKTTLKGLGRQYGRSIEGKPVWSRTISGGCRSGRYGTVGMLAVVDRDDPLRVTGWGDCAEAVTVP